MSILDFSLTVNRSWTAAHDDDFVTISDVARALGVSRNDMHRVPVARRPLAQTQCYRKGDIVTWAEQDLKSPHSVLRALQAKHSAAGRKRVQHAEPYTKTGGLKKRFRVIEAQRMAAESRALVGQRVICPECGEDYTHTGHEPRYPRNDRGAAQNLTCWYCGNKWPDDD